MYIKPADMVMHGFQVPNWLPFRYSFIFSFLVLVMAFRAFENLEGITFKNVGGVFLGLMLFLFWCEREDLEYFKDYIEKTTDEKKSVAIQGIWLSMIVVCLYFAFIYLVKKYGKTRLICISMTVIVCGELFLNAADTVDKINSDVVYSSYESYEPYLSQLRNAVDMMKDFDKAPFYRMEANFHRTVNDAIGSGYYGISHSSSVMNSKTLTALQKLGYAFGGHYVRYKGATPLTDSVFGIKYIMSKTGDTSNVDTSFRMPEQYKLTTSYKQGKTTFEFYKNPNSLGLGVVAKGDLSNVKLSEDNPFENQNKLFSAITGENKNYFNRLKIVDTEEQNLAIAPMEGGDNKYFQADESLDEVHKDYVVRMDRDSHLYMFFPADYKKGVNVWVKDNDEYLEGDTLMDYAGQFFEDDDYSILDLGKYSENQEVRVRVTIANDDKYAYWSDEIFCSFDYDSFAKKCNELQASTLDITKFEDTYIEGTVNAEADGQQMFTSIPYEDGWKVTVNGRNVTPSRCVEGLMMIPLEKGENKVTFKFAPDYFTLSIVITIVGILLVLFIFVVEYKKGKYMKIILAKMFGEKTSASNGEKAINGKEIETDIQVLKNENSDKN